MAEHLRLINDQTVPLKWGSLVMTETSSEILRSISHISNQPGALTMIGARPGAGKTETLLRYSQNNPGTIMHSVVASEGKVWDVACALMDELKLGRPNAKRLPEERGRIAEAIGVERMIIFDEAQYLLYKNPRGGTFYDSFEWLRAMAEQGCFSIVFAGDLELLKIVAQMPQFDRRLRRRVIVQTVPKADVALIAASSGVSDKASVEALHVVSHLNGGLGSVVQVIEQARLFAGSQLLTAQHILAAIEFLNLRTGGRTQ